MLICNRDDFEEMKSKIKDGVLADSLFFDTDIYEDLSDVLVTGFVYINSKISNVNYIPSKIEGSLTIEPEISFAELEHDIYFDNIKVDNLLTTKGMSHLHLIYEIIPELKPIAVASVRFYLSDNFETYLLLRNANINHHIQIRFLMKVCIYQSLFRLNIFYRF